MAANGQDIDIQEMLNKRMKSHPNESIEARIQYFETMLQRQVRERDEFALKLQQGKKSSKTQTAMLVRVATIQGVESIILHLKNSLPPIEPPLGQSSPLSSAHDGEGLHDVEKPDLAKEEIRSFRDLANDDLVDEPPVPRLSADGVADPEKDVAPEKHVDGAGEGGAPEKQVDDAGEDVVEEQEDGAGEVVAPEKQADEDVAEEQEDGVGQGVAPEKQVDDAGEDVVEEQEDGAGEVVAPEKQADEDVAEEQEDGVGEGVAPKKQVDEDVAEEQEDGAGEGVAPEKQVDEDVAEEQEDGAGEGVAPEKQVDNASMAGTQRPGQIFSDEEDSEDEDEYPYDPSAQGSFSLEQQRSSVVKEEPEDSDFDEMKLWDSLTEQEKEAARIANAQGAEELARRDAQLRAYSKHLAKKGKKGKEPDNPIVVDDDDDDSHEDVKRRSVHSKKRKGTSQGGHDAVPRKQRDATVPSELVDSVNHVTNNFILRNQVMPVSFRRAAKTVQYFFPESASLHLRFALQAFLTHSPLAGLITTCHFHTILDSTNYKNDEMCQSDGERQCKFTGVPFPQTKECLAPPEIVALIPKQKKFANTRVRSLPTLPQKLHHSGGELRVSELLQLYLFDDATGVYYLHCGCILEEVLLDFFMWKTSPPMVSPSTGASEYLGNPPNPRIRAHNHRRFAAMGINILDLYTYTLAGDLRAGDHHRDHNPQLSFEGSLKWGLLCSVCSTMECAEHAWNEDAEAKRNVPAPPPPPSSDKLRDTGYGKRSGGSKERRGDSRAGRERRGDSREGRERTGDSRERWERWGSSKERWGDSRERRDRSNSRESWSDLRGRRSESRERRGDSREGRERTGDSRERRERRGGSKERRGGSKEKRGDSRERRERRDRSNSRESWSDLRGRRSESHSRDRRRRSGSRQRGRRYESHSRDRRRRSDSRDSRDDNRGRRGDRRERRRRGWSDSRERRGRSRSGSKQWRDRSSLRESEWGGIEAEWTGVGGSVGSTPAPSERDESKDRRRMSSSRDSREGRNDAAHARRSHLNSKSRPTALKRERLRSESVGQGGSKKRRRSNKSPRRIGTGTAQRNAGKSRALKQGRTFKTDAL